MNSAPTPPLSATLGSTSVTLSSEQFTEILSRQQLPPPALLTDEQAAARLGVSVRKLQELVHEPWFPKPILLGPRLKRHSSAQLDSAIANMPRQLAVGPEPLQLAKGRAARSDQTTVK